MSREDQSFDTAIRKYFASWTTPQLVTLVVLVVIPCAFAVHQCQKHCASVEYYETMIDNIVANTTIQETEK